MKRAGSVVFVAWVLAVGASIAPGCGGASVASICDKICECTGCSDAELAECVDEGEDLEKLAEDEGCGDQFDAYKSCFSDEIECVGDDIDADGCVSELADLGQCLEGAAPTDDTNGTDPGPAPGGGASGG